VNQQQLKKAWETSQRSTRDDWSEWLRKLSVELLKESPSHALRACAELANMYHPLARELFNAGFVSCWTELYDKFQVSIRYNPERGWWLMWVFETQHILILSTRMN
jgi:FKBP12-rapamycin complex-associated protein